MKFGLHILVIENILKKSRIGIFDIGFGMFEFGWGTGYVLLPTNHPFYEKDYDDIDVNIHGGLTFGQKFDSTHFLEWIGDRKIDGDITFDNFEQFNNYWIIGFDTNHFGDNEEKCSKEFVLSEANDLLEQCLDDNIEGINKYKSVYLRKNKLNEINASVLALSSKQYDA